MNLGMRFLRWVFGRAPWPALISIISGRSHTVVPLERQVASGNSFEQLEFPEINVLRALWGKGKLENLTSEPLPSFGFTEYRNILLSPSHRGGLILDGGRVVVPDNGLAGNPRVHVPNSFVDGVESQNRSKLLLRAPRPAVFHENGIFGGSKAPNNWYHWLVDTVSTLSFARLLPSRFDSFPFLVPQAVLDRTGWLEALALVSEGRPVVGVDSSSWHAVGELVNLDRVTRSAFPSLTGDNRARISFLLEPMAVFRDFVLEKLGLREVHPIPGHRIFLCRNQSTVRRYNQEEILADAKNRGFEPVYLEGVSLADSIRIFREAEQMTGPAGAGWASLIFAHPGSKAFLWLWPGSNEFNYYENLALFSGVRYSQVYTDGSSDGSVGVNAVTSDYYLDRSAFARGLGSL